MEKYLTRQGYIRLKAEFEELSFKERPKVVQGVSQAAAEGDRSENAEYIYGKKRLREIDKRLQYLSKLLKNPKVIDRSMIKNTDAVGFGCKVLVEDENGVKKTWTIVGEGESDIKKGTISISAPVARALLGKRVSDIAIVELGDEEIELYILDISIGDID